MGRLLVGLWLALAAFPAVAHAQDPQQRIDAARRRAESAGIPVALLDSKVAEGRAKGVPLDRIAVAVERRLGSLGRARDAMAGVPRGAPVSSDDLTVGADAIEAGVEPGVLGRLAAVAPAAHRAMAISALMDLVSQGESSERALARVTGALQRGPDALRRLPGEARSERSRGNGPPPGRGNPGQGQGNARGRGQGGPPAAVPGPTDRPGRGKGRGNNPNKPE
ncbi:MAG TPA: hypothetical protein VEQ60_15535 [Longimicrobium sp.]|nr:hypothetical protein [Longimicrobium sp.]